MTSCFLAARRHTCSGKWRCFPGSYANFARQSRWPRRAQSGCGRAACCSGSPCCSRIASSSTTALALHIWVALGHRPSSSGSVSLLRSRLLILSAHLTTASPARNGRCPSHLSCPGLASCARRQTRTDDSRTTARYLHSAEPAWCGHRRIGCGYRWQLRSQDYHRSTG